MKAKPIPYKCGSSFPESDMKEYASHENGIIKTGEFTERNKWVAGIPGVLLKLKGFPAVSSFANFASKRDPYNPMSHWKPVLIIM